MSTEPSDRTRIPLYEAPHAYTMTDWPRWTGYGEDAWPVTNAGTRLRIVCSWCGRDLGDRPTDEACCSTYMRAYQLPADQLTLFDL